MADEVEDTLLSDVISFQHDPVGFVQYAYPWGDGELSGSDGPRDWQYKVLTSIGDHLSDPETRFQPLMVAVASGHGVGKSALIAQISDWAMSTCDDCRVVVTANTDTQLRTKTWPEIGKWFRLSINAHWFSVTATAVASRDKDHDRSWRADAVPWSEENTEAFAGLHNQGKRIVVVFDEASAIADKVWEVTEGALTDEQTEIIWIAFGNPTRNTGRFRECFGKFKHRWITLQIDSRTVDGTNKSQIKKWIDDYGEDSDFVRVRVRGEFPRSGSNQFIGSDIVDACVEYSAQSYDGLPKVLAVDVARFGDDSSVLCRRQGRKVWPLVKFKGLDTMQLASQVVKAIREWQPDAVVIDGVGVGAGVVDRVVNLGYGSIVTEMNGGSTPDDPETYCNKRAEVWGLMRDALKVGMEIPNDRDLKDDLTGPEYGFTAKQQIQLEKKEDMKKRGLASPDCGDALAMTFAVQPRKQPKRERGRSAREVLDPMVGY